MSSGVLGSARRSRGIFEGPEWVESLGKAGIPVAVWDERFAWAVENVSVQPLENTSAFASHELRLMQIYLPNSMIGWLYFRIEPDDENCTLLWVETRRFNRIG